MLGKLYSEMIFVKGYVHCDPHPGNVLVHKSEDDVTKVVLLDHGLYVVSIPILCTTPFRNINLS